MYGNPNHPPLFSYISTWFNITKVCTISGYKGKEFKGSVQFLSLLFESKLI